MPVTQVYISPTVKALDQEIKRQDIPLTRLASKTGIHHSSIYRILSGEISPKVETLEALAAGLGLSLRLVQK